MSLKGWRLISENTNKPTDGWYYRREKDGDSYYHHKSKRKVKSYIGELYNEHFIILNRENGVKEFTDRFVNPTKRLRRKSKKRRRDEEDEEETNSTVIQTNQFLEMYLKQMDKQMAQQKSLYNEYYKVQREKIVSAKRQISNQVDQVYKQRINLLKTCTKQELKVEKLIQNVQDETNAAIKSTELKIKKRVQNVQDETDAVIKSTELSDLINIV